ncbi:MAG TPA: P-II family nitrogen regulator [Pirellulales bacterium]|jgi:nitrogen regulatory protein PII|nr:P-II family nitrogen regulator [Pirellulales bacterium]
MKLIEAIIRRSKVDDVVHALTARGINAMTITDVRGTGRDRTFPETYRGIEHTSPFLPRVKLEAVVDDANADDAVDAILLAAVTGKVGDGRVLIIDVEAMIHIRTGERQGGCLASAGD